MRRSRRRGTAQRRVRGLLRGRLHRDQPAPMVKPLPQGRGLPRDAAHELTLTVCHELAHLLERGGDHGQKWRATQDSLAQAVLLHVAGEGLEQGEGKEGAGAFEGIGGCRCCK